MKTVLGIDASTTACSAALIDDGRIISWRFEAMERGQAERLNPMIGEVMADAGCAFVDLSLVAVTTGPGAFTGIRIGLACARAIALATGVPLAGVTSFAALARAIPESELEEARCNAREILVCVEGKRRDAFVQRFDAALRPTGEAGALDAAAAARALAEGSFLIAGDGAARLAPAFAQTDGRVRFSAAAGPPDARHVAALGAAGG
ncbi:MAG: tRNA ((37)-N6)-threonylcarbamoyltransferase complex dimerization subunit type 1 TsaB, partial [Pseudomonadota bacterium]